jgi:hypothetical protein
MNTCNSRTSLASDASIAIDKAYVHIIYDVRCLYLSPERFCKKIPKKSDAPRNSIPHSLFRGFLSFLKFLLSVIRMELCL